MAPDDGSDHFQPEKPHPQTKGSDGVPTTILVVAVAVALMVMMVLAIAAPRLFGESVALRWGVLLGAGALTFAAIVGVSFMRRRSRG